MHDDLRAHVRTIADFPQPGIQFRDVTTLLLDADAFRTTVDRLAARVGDDVDLVAGVDARGFVVASAIAYATGRGLVLLRKPGKLPGPTVGVDYDLEYGTDRLEVHADAVTAGQHVVLVDDLIATGGTARAGVELLRGRGAVVTEALFVIDLPDLGGAARLRDAGVAPHALLTYAGA